VTAGEPLIRWDWVATHAGEIGQRVGEHFELTVIAVVVGFLIAFVLSLVALRIPKLYGPITWTTGILYTIPSLALFALLIPYTGLSLLSAEIGPFPLLSGYHPGIVRSKYAIRIMGEWRRVARSPVRRFLRAEWRPISR